MLEDDLSGSIPAQHARQLMQAFFTLQPLQAGAGPPSPSLFGNVIMLIRHTGDLMQVRYENYLALERMILQTRSD